MDPVPIIVLVTGANTGLGFETVKALYQSSTAYTIILSGRSLDKAEAAAEKIKNEITKSASTIKTLSLDIESDDSIKSAFDYFQRDFGKLDILINNAGEPTHYDRGYSA